MIKKKTLRPIRLDRQLLFEYRRLLRILVKRSQEILLQGLEKDIHDKEIKKADKIAFNASDLSEKIKSMFEHIGLFFSMLVPSFNSSVRNIFIKMDLANRRKFSKALFDKVGINLSAIIKEKSIQQLIQLATDQNLSLIKTMLDKELQAVKNLVYQQVRTGTFDAKELKDFIVKEARKTEKHADFIAIDQTHKFNASLTELRHKSIEVKEYYWRNAGDRRVRGNPAGLYPNAKYSHWDREGKVYSYNRPPPDGNPGQPIRCRCYAEAILPDEFNQLFKAKRNGERQRYSKKRENTS